MTGGETPDASQCVLEGSGSAPGAGVMASLDAGPGRGHTEARADVELCLEVLGTGAEMPRAGPLRVCAGAGRRPGSLLGALHVQHRPAQLLRCDLADHVQQDRLARSPAAEDRPGEAGCSGPASNTRSTSSSRASRPATTGGGVRNRGVWRSQHLLRHR